MNTITIVLAVLAGIVVALITGRAKANRERITTRRARRAENAVDDSVPFMEHPSEKDENAIDAMTDAVFRLRQMQGGTRWITFSAQGQGHRVDSYHFAELRLSGDRIDPGDAVLDADEALRAAGLDRAGVRVTKSPEGHFVMHGFDPRHVAEFMNALFRGQLGIRPHEDGDDDYAVGAEW